MVLARKYTSILLTPENAKVTLIKQATMTNDIRSWAYGFNSISQA